MRMICLLNFITVAVYGMVLSMAFCDIVWTRRRCLAMTGSMAVLLTFQGVIYFSSGLSDRKSVV